MREQLSGRAAQLRAMRLRLTNVPKSHQWPPPSLASITPWRAWQGCEDSFGAGLATGADSPLDTAKLCPGQPHHNLLHGPESAQGHQDTRFAIALKSCP